MKFRILFALLLSVGLVGSVSAGSFSPKPPDRSAVADLPASQHHKNVGGSDGAGLCVYTSMWHASLWQDEIALYGLRKWCESRPGGSYPEKLARDITSFCKQQNLTEPPYVQFTNGDPSLLELALKTGRMPGVTYDGRDDFYRGRISHMVNLVYLDQTKAAILDNNRPGVFVWMSRADFLSRWKGGGGGWAVILLRSPPPPYATPGPTPKPDADPTPQPCPGPWCPREIPPGGTWVGNANGQESGYWIGDKCQARAYANGDVYLTDEFGNPRGRPLNNFGVETDKLDGREHYWIGGTSTNRDAVRDALVGDGLIDDSDRWNLTIVGTGSILIPNEYLTRLHVKIYQPSDWEVAQFGLKPGITLRKPAVNRVGAEIGVVQSQGDLYDLLAVLDGKPWPKPVPPPAPPIPVPPIPIPDPQPPTPAPQPGPPPDDKYTVPDSVFGGFVGAILTWILGLLKRKGS